MPPPFIDWLLGRNPTQLDRIESTVNRLEQAMSQQEQDLDTIIAAVAEATAAVAVSAAAIIAAIEQLEAEGKIDLSDESLDLTGIKAQLTKTVDDLNAAIPTPPPAES